MADWNKRYQETDQRLFGENPNEYVREVMARSDTGIKSALMIADGDGRNGAWLAAQGIDVTAVDISNIATEQAREHDKKLGVTVARITADLETWTPDPDQTFDAAFMIYLQCENNVRRRAAGIAAAALNEHGWFAAEGFATGDDGSGELGPGKADLLYDPESLLSALPDFRIVEALSGQIFLDEGVKHRGTGWVFRLLARKP
ncbi:MAG: class I SAM-dependent methyltransferase [Rhodospirillales bacterium]|nr:class I SAM-dependent methyltransferase [Rhodospirillales bacterium]